MAEYLRLLLVVIIVLVRRVEQIAFSDNSCQTLPINGDPTTVQFRACLSEPLTVLTPGVADFNLSVSPLSATCGAGRQLTCTLGIYQTCTYCDNSDPNLSHPPAYLTDYNSSINSNNFNTYWQSVTWLIAGGAPQATITISFGRLFQLWDDLVITFQSVRPQQMAIDKSVDNGVTWQTIQFYNKSCASQWNNGVGSAVTAGVPDIVTCSQDYSVEYPSVGGQVVFSVFDRFRLFLGPSSLDYGSLYYAFNTTNLISFLSFTDLRIRLIYPATDGKEAFNNAADLVRYYYAVQDIRIIAGCWCNLHAKYCVLRSGRMVCQCSHNTAGDNCDQCLPLYNNRPWSQGSYLPYPTGTPNECQMCNCNNHSSSCIYNPSLGYGQCVGCTLNTAGNKCDQCAPGFFQNSSLPLTDPGICALCMCQILGVLNNDLTCTMVGGQCNCKPLVMGRQCDICYDGYYGLITFGGNCQGCACNTHGTVGQSNVCDKQTGQCPCKPGIMSRDCSICRDGFYEFPYFFSTQDCVSCQCDPGGALNPTCDKQAGQCSCRPFMTGRRCSLSADNYYVPLLDMNNLKPNPVTCQPSTDLYSPMKPYTDRTFVLCNQLNTASFDPLLRIVQPRLIWNYIPALRYGLNGSVPWTSVTLTIRANGFNSSVNLTQYLNDPSNVVPASCILPTPYTAQMQNLTTGFGNAWVNVNSVIALDVRCTYSATLTADSAGGASQPLLVDSLVLIPDYHSTQVYANETNPVVKQQYDGCVQRYLALQTKDLTKTDATCRQFMLSAMAEIAQGALRCDCDPVGAISTLCDSVGGQCQCRPGVTGRRCEFCQPGYYNLTVNGCTPCNCDLLGSKTPVCDYTTGQCPCQPNVALVGQITTIGLPSDLQCHFCAANYSGITSGQGCQPCNCSPIGGLSSQCAESGQCTCRPTIGGNKCDVCLPGYFSFSIAGCVLCNCSTSGAVNITCDNLSGSCYCKANVQGAKCDTCRAGTFNVAPGNPDGCQPCFCFGHGTQCTSASGFQELIITDSTVNWKSALDNITYIAASPMFLGDMHYAYGQWLTYVAQTRTGVVVNIMSSSQPVILEGNGLRLVYSSGVNYTVSNNVTQLTYAMHQSFWYNAADLTRPVDAATFYGVLASLTRILIQQRFGYDFITVSAVSMRSAAPTVDGSSQVTYVENCTCIPTHNVAGLSCGNCSQGYQRPNPTANPLTSCTLCNCNNRAITNPPMCNEGTGICLNCHNGSVGDHCESCSTAVTGAACDTCVAGFWGISQTGCSACNCSSFSTSPICNSVSGQCACDPARNVGGQRCDQCLDNYVNTSNGCQQCSTCYGLVVAKMKDLRTNQTNLASLVTQLLSQDNSSTLGPFYSRLSAVTGNVTALNDFNNRANALQLTLPGSIATLQSALFNLTIQIASVIAPESTTTANTIQSTSDTLAAAGVDINSTNLTLIQAYSQLTNDMPGFTNQLSNLMASLQSVLNSISGSSDAIINGVQLLNQTVTTIESNAANASTSSQLALQIAQNAVNLQNTLTTQLIPLLTQSAQSLNAVGQQTNNTALIAMNAAMALFQNASDLLQSLQTFTFSPIDVTATSAYIQQQMVLASTLTNQTQVAQIASQPVLSLVQTDNTLTAQLLQQVNGNKTYVDGLSNRIAAANQTATNAVVLAQNTTDQAQRMLNIMTNFDATAQSVQNQANQSLQTVQRIRDLSQQASSASNQILASLQTSISSSTQAQQIASQALTEANTLNQMLNPISNKSTILLAQSSSVLNDIQPKSSDVDQKNATIVTSLANSLNTYLAATVALEQRAALARATADNVTAQVQQMQATIASLSARLLSIPTLDNNAIAQLQSNVQQLHAYYNSLNLIATVASLNNTISNQRIWINAMKLRRDDLQQQIARLSNLLSQLRT